MKHDESALVREALRQAEERLASGQPLMPAAYMLVQRNPQTGAQLTFPTAIGLVCEKPFESHAAYLEFLAKLRSEAKRLEAIAVALGGQAEAEIDSGPSEGRPSEGRTREIQRVFYLRVEDAAGVHHLHAAIERSESGGLRLGTLFDSGAAADDLPEPLMPAVAPVA